ncbi:MAG: glycosyltransferase family 4 protein [Anaerolineae bacterium]
MKVCLLSDCYPPSIGGIENHVYCLAHHLAEMGHTVDVITHRPVASSAAPLPPEGPEGTVTVHRLKGFVAHWRGGDPYADPRLGPQVRSLLQAGAYDVVHGHTFDSLITLAGLRQGKKLGMATVVTKHSMTGKPQRPKFVNEVLLAMERQVSRRWCSALIVLNEPTARQFARTGVPVHVVPGGVNCQHWRPDAALRQRQRRALGYGEGDVVIGCLARLVPAKGVDSLLRAAALIRRAMPAARVLLVGDGPMRRQLERQASALGLSDVVAFTGFQPWWQTPQYLNAMDIFALPSHSEAFGLALLEAMACALPAVARESEGTSRIMLPGETGFLVRSDEELRGRLLQLLQDTSLRQRLGARARQHVQEQFGWAGVAAQVGAVYEAIVGHMPAAISAVAARPSRR